MVIHLPKTPMVDFKTIPFPGDTYPGGGGEIEAVEFQATADHMFLVTLILNGADAEPLIVQE